MEKPQHYTPAEIEAMEEDGIRIRNNFQGYSLKEIQDLEADGHGDLAARKRQANEELGYFDVPPTWRPGEPTVAEIRRAKNNGNGHMPENGNGNGHNGNGNGTLEQSVPLILDNSPIPSTGD